MGCEGGGCGVGVGLGWGFGAAYGTPYVDSKPTFEGFDFRKMAALLGKDKQSGKPQMQKGGGENLDKQLITATDENLPR